MIKCGNLNPEQPTQIRSYISELNKNIFLAYPSRLLNVTFQLVHFSFVVFGQRFHAVVSGECHFHSTTAQQEPKLGASWILEKHGPI